MRRKLFSQHFPQLAEQWDFEKNAADLSALSVRDETVFHWRCSKGHQFRVSIASRVRLHKGSETCPVCKKLSVLEKRGALFWQRFPELEAQYDAAENVSTTFRDIVASGKEKLVWKCPQGHRYEASPVRFVQGFARCRTCYPQRAVHRSAWDPSRALSVKFPDLAKEWAADLNSAELSPNSVTYGSNKKVWWRCSLGHEFQAVIATRAFQGNGCPFCSGKRVLVGFNDLPTTHPHKVQFWDYSRNTRSPTEVTAGSNKAFFWRCKLGHSFQNTPHFFAGQGHGCSVCAGKELLKGFNDLKTRFPAVASLWDLKQNAGIAPDEVFPGSTKLRWWTCKYGHQWKASPNNLTRGRSCPQCAEAEPGVNDLETLFPELAAEWDAERNSDLHPSMVPAGSAKRVWWKCEQGHSWATKVAIRTSGHSCPECADTGFNQTQPAILYYFTNVALFSSKIGIAQVGSRRIEIMRRHGWRLMAGWEGKGRNVLDAETFLKRILRNDLGIPQHLDSSAMPAGGQTETFASTMLSQEETVTIIRDLAIEFGLREMSSREISELSE